MANSGGNRIRIGHFLGRAGREVAAPGVGFQKDLVRKHVQLLLRFALHVHADCIRCAGLARYVAQQPLADRDRDALAGARDHFDQEAKVRNDAAVPALFLGQVLGERDGLHGGFLVRGAPLSRLGRRGATDC